MGNKHKLRAIHYSSQSTRCFRSTGGRDARVWCFLCLAERLMSRQGVSVSMRLSVSVSLSVSVYEWISLWCRQRQTAAAAAATAQAKFSTFSMWKAKDWTPDTGHRAERAWLWRNRKITRIHILTHAHTHTHKQAHTHRDRHGHNTHTHHHARAHNTQPNTHT